MVRVYSALSHDATYNDVSKMLIFLSNHDHYRVADAWRQNPDKLKIAYTLLATVRGIPQISTVTRWDSPPARPTRATAS